MVTVGAEAKRREVFSAARISKQKKKDECNLNMVKTQLREQIMK